MLSGSVLNLLSQAHLQLLPVLPVPPRATQPFSHLCSCCLFGLNPSHLPWPHADVTFSRKLFLNASGEINYSILYISCSIYVTYLDQISCVFSFVFFFFPWKYNCLEDKIWISFNIHSPEHMALYIGLNYSRSSISFYRMNEKTEWLSSSWGRNFRSKQHGRIVVFFQLFCIFLSCLIEQGIIQNFSSNNLGFLRMFPDLT